METTAQIITFLACLMAASVPVRGTVDYVKVQNVSGVDFAPGQLKLPLTVQERSGVERKGAVVTSGVPFPPGFLADAGKLAVVDKDGKSVMSQASVMIKWHKPAYDDSVRWALVSFAADVSAGGTATYYLVDNGKTGVETPAVLKLNKTDKEIAIDTGGADQARFVIPLAGQALLAKASLGGIELLGRTTGLRGIVVTGAWDEKKLKAGDKEITTHDAAGVIVEEAGPARLVIAIKGTFLSGDVDKKFYGYLARLYFTAGSPEVRIAFTLTNGRPGCIWPITGASLTADLPFAGKANASVLADAKPVTEVVGDDPIIAFQSTLDIYKLSVGPKELACGARAQGVIDVSDAKMGITATRRYFREEWPSAIAASARELRVGLFPAEANSVFHLASGQQKTWDIHLSLHGAHAPDLAACFARQDALLLFRPDPNWMVQMAGVTGAWPGGLAMAKAPARKLEMRRSENLRGAALTGGWQAFGVIEDWNASGSHWNEGSEFNNWVIHGDGGEFDNSEISTLWAADHCPIHLDSADPLGCFRANDAIYPGAKQKPPCAWPDTGHMGMWMWMDYYLLTGDGHCRDAICHLGDVARMYLSQWTQEPKNGKNIPGRKKHDPDAEPDFKLDRRYVGWPLYCLTQYYELTGDADLLAEARIINGAFRNTARACPIGMLCRDCAGKDGKPGAEYSNNIIAGFDAVDSQARECKRSASLVCSNFYSGIIIYGIREYYLASRDPDALDVLVGQADRFCQYTMIRDSNHKMLGWSYVFGDYWGPYTLEDSMKNAKPTPYMRSANELTSDAVAMLYHLTGRADVMEAVTAAMKVNGVNEMVWAIYMAGLHPKVDQTPLPPIKDLAGEALGGGKVKLTWTAPGGSGLQIASYQVKWTTAQKLVERIAGWPDRTEPLPVTPDEWLARAKAFNARQRSFWAANNASNPPKPAAAGAKESMVVEGLAAGATINIAVKSWSRAQNISEMSNVVTLLVR